MVWSIVETKAEKTTCFRKILRHKERVPAFVLKASISQKGLASSQTGERSNLKTVQELTRCSLYHHYTVNNTEQYTFSLFPSFSREIFKLMRTTDTLILHQLICRARVWSHPLLTGFNYRCFKMSIMGTYSYLNILKMPNSKHREFFLQLNWLC